MLQVHWSEDLKLLKFCECLAADYRDYADPVNVGTLSEMISDLRRWEEKYVVREGPRPNEKATTPLKTKVSVKAVTFDNAPGGKLHKSGRPCFQFTNNECRFGDRCIQLTSHSYNRTVPNPTNISLRDA